jgi:hypothetical protein
MEALACGQGLEELLLLSSALQGGVREPSASIPYDDDARAAPQLRMSFEPSPTHSVASQAGAPQLQAPQEGACGRRLRGLCIDGRRGACARQTDRRTDGQTAEGPPGRSTHRLRGAWVPERTGRQTDRQVCRQAGGRTDGCSGRHRSVRTDRCVWGAGWPGSGTLAGAEAGPAAFHEGDAAHAGAQIQRQGLSANAARGASPLSSASLAEHDRLQGLSTGAALAERDRRREAPGGVVGGGHRWGPSVEVEPPAAAPAPFGGQSAGGGGPPLPPPEPPGPCGLPVDASSGVRSRGRALLLAVRRRGCLVSSLALGAITCHQDSIYGP